MNVLRGHVSATLDPHLGIPFLEKDLVQAHPRAFNTWATCPRSTPRPGERQRHIPPPPGMLTVPPLACIMITKSPTRPPRKTRAHHAL